MKEVNNDDFWCYGKVDGVVKPIYKVDDFRGTQGEALQYLQEKHNMEIDEAQRYLNQLRHI